MKAVTQIVYPLVLSLSAFAFSSTSIAANLVVNGSFEGMAADGTAISATTSLNGWIVQSGNIDIMCWGSAVSQDSQCHIDLLGSYSPATISQAVATTAGTQYELSFYWAPNAEWQNFLYPNDSPVKGLNVLIDSAIVGTYTRDSTGTYPWGLRDWSLQTSVFTATSSSTTISFSSWNQSGVYGAFLDNVQLNEYVSEVPLPGTLGLLGIGLAGLGLVRRKAA